MKAFDILSIIVFGIFIPITFVGGFYNWIHFVLCAFCVSMFSMSVCELNQIIKQEKRYGNKSL